MAGDIRIDTVNINIENLSIAPEAVAIPEDFHDVFTFLRNQIAAGAAPEVMGEMGYPTVSEDAAQPDDVPTPEEQAEIDQNRAEELTQEMINLDTRSDNLHVLVSQIDKMNSKKGFRTNDERVPHTPKTIDEIRSTNKQKAKKSLARACSACVLRNNCSLTENLDAWLDVHPYKDRNGRRRPGSLRVEPPESRTKFIQRLRANPEIHCDPAKRK